MKKFTKMSVLDALTRFRNEIKDMRLSSSDRIHAMEEFKYWFNESFDYDLAFDRVARKLIPEMANIKSFKSYWNAQNVSKGFFADLFSTEESKIRGAIKEAFQDGKQENYITNTLMTQARQFFDRPLQQNEIDKIRYYVISEKVRLYDKK